MNTLKTPLFAEHKKLGAKCAPFGGWMMPIQYEGIINEHKWTRTNCSLFDICHMGEFELQGDFAKNSLDQILTQDISNMPVLSCRYGFMLNEQGGIIDDVIVYKIRQDKLMMVVNAATTAKDFEHLSRQLGQQDIKITDISANTSKLDLQGPISRDVLHKVLGDAVLNLDYYTFDYFNVLGEDIIISRTGYTGELGFELYISTEKVVDLWNLLLSDQRVKPAGLGARDTLRLEVCYPLYGQDIDADTTPFEAGLGSFVDMEKVFIGKDSVKATRDDLKRKLCCFKTEGRRAPRHDYDILTLDSKKIGIVTSGSYSPSLGCGIGMGYIAKNHCLPGTKLILKNNATEINAEVVKKPFYTSGSLKS
jgi:aminomethyltransferase